MQFAAIMALVVKGLNLIAIGVEAGREVGPAIEAIKRIASAPEGSVTQQMMDETHAVLDQQLAEFNKPMDGEA